MNYSEYVQFDMLGLAQLVARGEVTATELLDTAFDRLCQVNPLINAVIAQYEDRARIEARTPRPGPMSGVPFLLKDHGALLAGTPTSLGSRVFQAVIQQADSANVSALRDSGLIIVGKTNVPEMSNDAVTESSLFGPARNPWDLERSPGGSSGGAAAAVAAGVVPAAHATDGGGSIRVPAAHTGLFGLKPSRGRVSYAPQGEGGGGMVVQHALTRSVRDSAALLDLVCRPNPGDPYWLVPPEVPFLKEVERPPAKLRIGYSTGCFLDRRVSPQCQAAVMSSVRLCEELGHTLEEVDLIKDYPARSGLVNAAAIAATLDAEADRRGHAIIESEVDPVTWFAFLRGKTASPADYVRAIQETHAYGRRIARMCEPYDVVLTATTCAPPPRVGALRDEPLDIAAYFDRVMDYVGNTRPANISGQPAMTVPLLEDEDGLPIGVQFMAASGNEALLLRLAGQLEQAKPWFNRMPVLAQERN